MKNIEFLYNYVNITIIGFIYFILSKKGVGTYVELAGAYFYEELAV